MQRFKVFLFNCLLLFGLLAIVEIALRIKYPDYHYYYRSYPGQADLREILNKTDTSWLKAHPELGWVCQQKEILHFPTPPVDPVSYTINAQGFRNTFDFNDTLPADKKRILLLGDSFTFGIYLPEQETITAQVWQAKGQDYHFINLSVPAWGLDQMYLAYLEYIDLLQPDQVILSFIDDDFMRSLEILFHGCGRKPCLKIEHEQLVPNEDGPHWWEYLCWNNQIGNRLLRYYYEQRAAKLATFMLTDIIDREKKVGRKPAFIRIPALVDLQNQVPRPAFSMKELMEKKEMPYLELYDTLAALPPQEFAKYYFADDGHLTESGADLLTEYVLEMVE